MRDRLYVRAEGMYQDVAELVSLPIPQAVWETLKPRQDEDFVAFVAECLDGKRHLNSVPEGIW